jgi:hypothetical protein
MYKSSLRHIHDLVLSSLKMKGIHLLFLRGYGHFSPPTMILTNFIFQSQSFGWSVVCTVSPPALLLTFCVQNGSLSGLWFAWNSVMSYVWRFVFLSMQATAKVIDNGGNMSNTKCQVMFVSPCIWHIFKGYRSIYIGLQHVSPTHEI